MKISNTIHYVGVNDKEHSLFESHWPIPKGVTYNSYLVVGEKIALIDTVELSYYDKFIENIKEAIGDKPIDYLVVNHMEPDHSGLMSAIREMYPNIQIIASFKAIPMIEGFHGITDNVKGVKDGDIIDLGGASLTFKMIPMVHWPETMVTYYIEEETVFSGDAFGTFGAVEGKITDRYDEYESEMIRYYSNIVGKYGQPVQTALKNIAKISVKRICSTHGPIWEQEIDKVIALYDRLSKYIGKPGVCLTFSTMYGNTKLAAEAIAKELETRGIDYSLHFLNEESVSYAISSAFNYNTIVVGAPTYNNDIFPAAREFIYALKSRMLKNRAFGCFGSFTWAGGSIKLMNEMADTAKFNLIDEGHAFNHAFSNNKFNVSEFVDRIVETVNREN